MAVTKREIHICLCGASRTNSSGKWICDRAGKDCPGHGKAQTVMSFTRDEQEIVAAQKEEAKAKESGSPQAVAAPTPPPSYTVLRPNPTERWAESGKLAQTGVDA